MRLVADHHPEVDLWGARRRDELFEEAFATKLKLDWRPTAEALNRQEEATSGNGVAPSQPAAATAKPAPTTEKESKVARAKQARDVSAGKA
jgi:hypothetical protein